MKAYRVCAVYSGCTFGEATAGSPEEAKRLEEAFIRAFQEMFGEKSLLMGAGDFSVFVEEVERDSELRTAGTGGRGAEQK